MSVHPTKPYIFATVSRDRSIRIYDLRLNVSDVLAEAYWPVVNSKANGSPYKARHGRIFGGPVTSVSPAHGGSIPGGEGTNIGKCVLNLHGETPGGGGHKASVLASVCQHLIFRAAPDIDFHTGIPVFSPNPSIYRDRRGKLSLPSSIRILALNFKSGRSIIASKFGVLPAQCLRPLQLN